MLKCLTEEQRWAFVSGEVQTMCNNTKEKDLADCLQTMLKEFDKTAVIELAHQIWLEDRENNMLIDVAYNNIVTALA